MHRKKTALLIIACLACALLLSACHTNSDPWPVSSGATNAPASPAETAQPAPADQAPQATQVEHMTVPQETVAPGYNG